MSVYLDWNATAPKHFQVTAAMARAEQELWGNPSSVHQVGRAARRRVEDVRELLGRLLYVSARDVVFTSGGTEANHLALAGARVLVTSHLEHPSIVAQAQWLAEQGARVVFAEVTSDGVVSAAAIEAALDEALPDGTPDLRDPALGGVTNRNTPLVTLQAANHETGVLQPLEEVAEVVHRRGARLHVDAVQLLGRGNLDPLQVADSVAVAAHKLRGPKGVGALAFSCGFTPLPTARGGAQERGLRPGTLDAVAMAGFGAALERLEDSRAGYLRAAECAKWVEERLLALAVGGAIVHGAGAPRLGHVLNFRVPGWRGDELVAALDVEGVCVSSGSACSAGTAEPSPVITAMLGRAAAGGAVRVSFGEESTLEDGRALWAALVRLGVVRTESTAAAEP